MAIKIDIIVLRALTHLNTIDSLLISLSREISALTQHPNPLPMKENLKTFLRSVIKCQQSLKEYKETIINIKEK